LAGQQQPGNGGNTPHPQPQKGNKASTPKVGDWLWLKAHNNLPPDQQEKALENDPGFKKLSPQHQAELKERLRKFDSLSPQERERALRQREVMARLTPEQRAQVRSAHQQLQGLTNERRLEVHKELRKLVRMSPDQRQQTFDSDEFKSSFSDQEQTILKNLAGLNFVAQNGNPSPR